MILQDIKNAHVQSAKEEAEAETSAQVVTTGESVVTVATPAVTKT